VQFVEGFEPERSPQERPGRIEYLYLTEEQKPVVDALDRAIDNLPQFTRLRCRSPEMKTIHGEEKLVFPHVDYDERTPPSEREADLMCRTNGIMCPVAAQCFASGLVQDADGVWGGRVLVDGKDYYKKEKNG